jgi:hypothetical protein
MNVAVLSRCAPHSLCLTAHPHFNRPLHPPPAHRNDTVKFLHLIRPFMVFIPEISNPERKVSYPCLSVLPTLTPPVYMMFACHSPEQRLARLPFPVLHPVPQPRVAAVLPH